MTTDRELLELAAKAAGLRVRTWDGHSGAMCAIDDDRHGLMWMPLTDDGDALRLAVKLGLRVKVEKNDHAEVDNGDDLAPMCWQAVANGQDIYVATRRAIVRAAAAIGKAMK